MQVLFYTTKTTPRVKFIAHTLLSALGVSCSITENIGEYKTFAAAKINYSDTKLEDNEVWIKPVALLFERGIKPQKIECFNWNDTKAFFKTEGDFAFDIFAASFYLITRYEEYLPHDLDEYGRYAHKNSVAFKEGFLHSPLVNFWLQELKRVLSNKYSALIFKPISFKLIPTYDIDIAWNYLNKGAIRTIGGAAKSLLKGDWKSIKERTDVVTGNRQDPFDIYNWLHDLHKQCSLQPYYFFLLAKKYKGYDRNVSPANSSFRALIKKISLKNAVGIHPSWQSGDDFSLLEDEIKTLRDIIEREVNYSRQHYIKMSLPDTYRNLVKAGINEDYSMGYGSINGFRASYCLPHKWYDLPNETTTELTIFPFCYMEANSYFEQKYTLQEAKEELHYYYSVTKQVGGSLVTIFHNHTLGNKQDFAGWKEMYEEFLTTPV